MQQALINSLKTTDVTNFSIGLLIFRLGIGGMMAFAHGFGKVQTFFTSETIQWADPLGIGMAPSLFLAGSAEFFCSLAVVLGLGTRLASIPVAFTMAVAVFIVHASDPFQKQEFALLYLFAFLLLAFTGAGRYSLDHWITKKVGDA